MHLLKLSLLMFSLLLISCGDEHENEHDDEHEHEHEHENDHKHNYLNVSLRIFTGHPELVLSPAQFETVTEQVLTQDAHRVGATFETVTEQVLKSDAYNLYNILDAKEIPMVTDDEINKISIIPCITFIPTQDVMSIEIPAEYETRTIRRVLVDGTGAEVPATYDFRNYERLIIPALLNVLTEERAYEDYQFRILEDIDIHDYIASQLSVQGISDCLLTGNYEILP